MINHQPEYTKSKTPSIMKWKTLLAFGVIYFVWGSTYFAIRVGVQEFPPLVMAALRFFTAGAVLTVWAFVTGEAKPKRREWLAVALLGFLIFVIDYGILFWAEQRIPSGVAAVILATVPAYTAVFEILLLGTRRFSLCLIVALLLGIFGVFELAHPSGHDVGSVYLLEIIGLLIAAASWSIASVLSRLLPLPTSKAMSSGTQMLCGGIFLAVIASALGQMQIFHPTTISLPAWFALLYLIVAGSIVGFTAYVWLVHRESPTKVGTYAYVNPVIAVVIGCLLGGEAINYKIVIGTAFILASVFAIMKSNKILPYRLLPGGE